MQNYLAAVGLLLAASLGTDADAATFSFQGSGPWTFNGSFQAVDLNDDGRITEGEVTSFQALAGNFSGGPGQWGVVASSAGGGNGFFNIDFDYRQNSLSTLAFGYSAQFPCRVFPSGEFGDTRTVSGSASVQGQTTVISIQRQSLTNSMFPPDYCEAFSVTPFSVEFSQVVRVTGAGVPTVVPLPAGLALLATGLGLFGLFAARARVRDGVPA